MLSIGSDQIQHEHAIVGARTARVDDEGRRRLLALALLPVDRANAHGVQVGAGLARHEPQGPRVAGTQANRIHPRVRVHAKPRDARIRERVREPGDDEGPSRGSLRLDGDGFTSSPSVARLIISAAPACGAIYRRVVMPVANASARNANTSGPYVTPPKYPKL